MNDYAALILGIVCAGAGGELFVRGAVGIARWLRISPGIIGATIVAFGTSSPELSIAVSSALAGNPRLSLGDALGSNVVNVALILASALVISGIQCPRGSLKRDFPVALVVPVILGVLVLDGVVSRIDGLLLLGIFAVWIAATIVEARDQRSAAAQDIGAKRTWPAMLSAVGGLVLLIVGAVFIVAGAKGIAAAFGVDQFIIGATIVAVGTSTPELATAIVAKLRGHDEMSLGAILGSNVFNGLFVIGVAATIHPITVGWREIYVALVFGVVALALTFPSGRGFIERRRGVILLVLYAVYLAIILQYRIA
ncbi:MAG: sodium:calcium antiporter [Burkholderiales bacterium]